MLPTRHVEEKLTCCLSQGLALAWTFWTGGSPAATGRLCCRTSVQRCLLEDVLLSSNIWARAATNEALISITEYQEYLRVNRHASPILLTSSQSVVKLVLLKSCHLVVLPARFFCFCVWISLQGHCNPRVSPPCPICCVFLSLTRAVIQAVVFNLLWHKAVMTELPSSDRRPALSQPLNLSLIHPHSSVVAARPEPSHHTLLLI